MSNEISQPYERRPDLRLKLDCRHYRGDRPCAVGIQGACPTACSKYSPMGHRILVIKLGALGDVIRTAALLPGLKAHWPKSQITWVTRPNGVRMLKNHPMIDRLLPFDAETICHVEHERFDLCLSLDKEPGPAALAMRIDAADRRGIGLSAHGTPMPLNPECADYFLLGLDDRKKYFENTKSCPQLLYEAVGLEYVGQRYRLYPGLGEVAWARDLWRDFGVGDHDVVVGLNTGAGRVFANKNWPPDKYVELIRKIRSQTGWRVALLGGPEERTLNRNIALACNGAIDTGCDHAEQSFAALLQRCNVVVTGDTMATHVAIALQVPAIVLFGPTCAQEIDVYGRGEKLVTGIGCSPCYRRQCDYSPNCMDDISVDRVFEAVQRWALPWKPAVEPVALYAEPTR
jgi:ADP-heptose:LPS heptosyltransferase